MFTISHIQFHQLVQKTRRRQSGHVIVDRITDHEYCVYPDLVKKRQFIWNFMIYTTRFFNSLYPCSNIETFVFFIIIELFTDFLYQKNQQETRQYATNKKFYSTYDASYRPPPPQIGTTAHQATIPTGDRHRRHAEDYDSQKRTWAIVTANHHLKTSKAKKTGQERIKVPKRRRCLGLDMFFLTLETSEYVSRLLKRLFCGKVRFLDNLIPEIRLQMSIANEKILTNKAVTKCDKMKYFPLIN